MDAIRTLKTKLFGVSEPPAENSKPATENPLNSAREKSTTHLTYKIGTDAQAHIQSSNFTNSKPSSSSGSVSNSAPANAAAPATHAPTNAATTFTPPKKIAFNPNLQEYLFSKLRPEAKSLASQYKLTKTEAAAIHAYTMDTYYKTINAALRVVNKDGNVDTSSAAALKNAGVTDDGLAEMIAATVSGMQKLPPTQTSDSVFLPLGRNDSVPEEFLEPYAQGACITIPAFYSSTVSMGTVEGWWDGSEHFISVLQNVGGNGRDVSAFSQFPNEQEVLFMPGTRFIVLGRTERTETPLGTPGLLGHFQTKTKILMQLQEVSSNPNDPLPPSVHPSTFQSLAPAEKSKRSKESDSLEAEKVSTYLGLR
jgi:hypothetical protein